MLWATVTVVVAACAAPDAPDISTEPPSTNALASPSPSATSEPDAASSPPASPPSSAAAASSERLTARPIGSREANLGYYEYLPPGYSDGQPRPLLVALHGVDGSGNGSPLELDNLFETGIPDLIRSDAWPADRPFVVLVPQHDFPVSDERYAPCAGTALFGSCLMELQHRAGHPPDESLCMTPSELHAFLSYAIAEYDVDPERVYLTGLSCGAFAAYEYAATYGAEQITAMVPIAGEARPAMQAAGCTLGEVAIWAFHGDRDDVNDVQGTIEPMNDLMDCPGVPEPSVRLTVYAGVDHDSWTRTYDLSANHDIYEWFLGITKSS